MDIHDYRRRIDAIDAEILCLLNERGTCARRIGEAKERTDLPTYAPDRERQVLDRLASFSEGPLPAESLRAIYREIISACRALEQRLRVSYWGPPASNTHVAATRRFGSGADYVEAGSVPEVFSALERGKADLGVIPIENSTEGVVARSLDMFLQSDLRICAEIYVPIQHNLLSRAASLSEVRRIYTMFQATAQCREWLAAHVPQIELVETTTTARGAEQASHDPEAAAIANLAAAERYGLNVLAEHIEDNPRNHTRFWVIGRLEARPSGQDKTSLLFAVRHQSGALVEALQCFARHNVSLTFIESRPTKQNPWEYVFFVDALGHAQEVEQPLHQAFRELQEQCLFLRVLGSYPEAE
jgi:chorismate mutase / prephenate dehydratase